MSQLVSIPVSTDELGQRISQVSIGDSLSIVSNILGGDPYKEEKESEKRRAFWRFHLTDRVGPVYQYEIYLGEFVNDLLVFGAIIPHGAAPNEKHNIGSEG